MRGPALGKPALSSVCAVSGRTGPPSPLLAGPAHPHAASAQPDFCLDKARKYYKPYCPWQDRHKKTIHLTFHLTPNRAYNRDVRNELKRRTCWKEDQGGTTSNSRSHCSPVSRTRSTSTPTT